MKVFIAVAIDREEPDVYYVEAFSTRELAEKYIEDVKNDYIEGMEIDFDEYFETCINESTLDVEYTA